MPAEITVKVLTLDELAPAITEHFGAPRPFSSTLPAPTSPGVYVWDVDGRIIYIGLAESSLRSRIDLHLSMIRGRRTDQSVPNMLRQYQAKPNWLVTASGDDAKLLERRLIEWHRVRVGSGSLVSGFQAKRGSPRWVAQSWATELSQRV